MTCMGKGAVRSEVCRAGLGLQTLGPGTDATVSQDFFSGKTLLCSENLSNDWIRPTQIAEDNLLSLKSTSCRYYPYLQSTFTATPGLVLTEQLGTIALRVGTGIPAIIEERKLMCRNHQGPSRINAGQNVKALMVGAVTILIPAPMQKTDESSASQERSNGTRMSDLFPKS